MDNSNLPLSPAEKAAYQARASAGESLPLEVVKRFILTIRKGFSSNPANIEKGKKSRNKKPDTSNDQIDFF